MSAMDVDAGVEEKKGGEAVVPATAAVSTERTQKGKGEGDRNIMLHPVRACSLTNRCLSTANLTILRLHSADEQAVLCSVAFCGTLDYIS